VRSSADASHRKRRVSFKSDVQESLKLLDTKPIFVWKHSYHKHKNQEILIMMCKTEKSKTQSKMHSLNNSSVQNLYFPLHDAILFQGHGKPHTRFAFRSIRMQGLS
jgi:hypothetical protein